MSSGRKKYSTELKLEIVQRYLKGDISLRSLAAQYHVDNSDIVKWRDAYLQHGVAGLCTTHGTYSGDFKVTVVEYIHRTEASLRQTAAYFNIPQKDTVKKWAQIYWEQGKEALYIENRGRSKKMESIIKKSSKKKKIEKNEELPSELG